MFFVVGAGIWGLTIAERIASQLHEEVVIIERRNHIGGNCYAYIDDETGIECHKYGSHIFHTSLSHVWSYINNFTKFNRYRHRVFANSGNKIFSLPINLHTINQFYNINLKPYEVKKFIENEMCLTGNQNLEEKAISLIGKRLYEAFIKGYTQKQWGCSPAELPPGIITRLPVRSSYNADYFSDTWQGIPKEGYLSLFKKMLDNKKIHLRLNTNFTDIKNDIPQDSIVFYSGMIDELHDYMFGHLGWRSLKFSWEKVNVEDYQGNSVINFVDTHIPYTRIHEFKHYHPEWEKEFLQEKTIICKEFPQNWTLGAEAYYPLEDTKNTYLYSKYLSQTKNIIIGGRLGAYRYWDMDKAIDNALKTFDTFKSQGNNNVQ